MKKTDIRIGLQTEELNSIVTKYGLEKGTLFSDEELKITNIEVYPDFTGIEGELHTREPGHQKETD